MHPAINDFFSKQKPVRKTMHMTGNVRKHDVFEMWIWERNAFLFPWGLCHTTVAFLRTYQVRLAYSWHIKGLRGGRKSEINKPGERIIWLKSAKHEYAAPNDVAGEYIKPQCDQTSKWTKACQATKARSFKQPLSSSSNPESFRQSPLINLQWVRLFCAMIFIWNLLGGCDLA